MFSLITKAFRASFSPSICLAHKVFKPFGSYSLAVSKSTTPATLEKKPTTLLINQWWSQSPFDANKPLTVPVYNFQTGAYVGENVDLDHSVFNVPLRRDIVHNVYHWKMRLGKITTHVTRTKGTTAGSGKKPFRQKGTGNARQGNKRAPGKKKGGKAHGAVPRDYTIKMPRKLRLQALKIMLSAKLSEGKLRIVDSEEIEEPKTKLVANVVKQFDDKTRLLMITGYKADSNFLTAYKNIPTVDLSMPHNLDILKLLRCDKIIITKAGLEQLIQNLKDRTDIRYRVGPRINRELLPSELQRIEAFGLKTKKDEMPKYDPTKPLDFKFKVLQDYLKDYEKNKSEAGKPVDGNKTQ